MPETLAAATAPHSAPRENRSPPLPRPGLHFHDHRNAQVTPLASPGSGARGVSDHPVQPASYRRGAGTQRSRATGIRSHSAPHSRRPQLSYGRETLPGVPTTCCLPAAAPTEVAEDCFPARSQNCTLATRRARSWEPRARSTHRSSQPDRRKLLPPTPD